MGDIYRTAKEVYIWLGIGDDDTNYALEHIEGKPQTRFDSGIFSTCVEKLFGASYWTRRWIIQEFSLAQERTIVCGGRLTKWRTLKSKSGNDVLRSDSSARQTLEGFKKVESLASGEKMSLLELMERFQNARCFEPHDRAFALRSIAENGDRLSPRYDESESDLYFRVLSTLPTERVFPTIPGYRWPHEAASRLQSCMPLKKQDLLKSLKDGPDDRLYTVFEYIGVILTVQDSVQNTQGQDAEDKFPSFPLKVQLQGPTKEFRGYGGLSSGDLIYSLQSTSRSPKGLYIAFGPRPTDPVVVGMLIQEPEGEKTIEFIRNIILGGVLVCRRINSGNPLHRRILCHISRTVLILLWLLDIGKLDCILSHQKEILDESVQGNLLCGCANDRATEHEDSSLEVLSSFAFEQDQTFWAEEITPPWTDLDQQPPQQQIQINENPQSDYALGFRYRKQQQVQVYESLPQSEDALDLDIVRGQVYHYFLSESSGNINFEDDDMKVPLWWVAYNGHATVVKMLLDAGANIFYRRPEQFYNAPPVVARSDINARENRFGKDLRRTRGLSGKHTHNPLHAASEGGHEVVVRLLLDGGAEVNAPGHNDHNALYHASVSGLRTVVKMLLDEGADINPPSGNAALNAASEMGHGTVVKMLLDAGADVNAPGENNHNALYHASASGHGTVVKILLDAGADINPPSGSAGLRAASEIGRVTVVKKLLEAGVDINARGELGQTPLQVAVMGIHKEVVRVLLKAGADVSGEDLGFVFRRSAKKVGVKVGRIRGREF
ncbi:hypothetical protein PV08_02734 [Exophiala spinifera]|uniref:Uncharacterized protein n=1 Tax=Exophiala spinifera TaxID=91928 RepID=A0A0D1YT25_9EURO|nr:uncharacterized protein PV08_02734 [Exophiala spinifera]KIW18446.1 hypothetical protein PV08_02734 [Exophiala spinifera]